VSILKEVTVAAVGPVVAEELRDRGVGVDLMPEQSFFMKPLVRELVRRFANPAAGPESATGLHCSHSPRYHRKFDEPLRSASFAAGAADCSDRSGEPGLCHHR